jgi:hypothetical protein
VSQNTHRLCPSLKSQSLRQGFEGDNEMVENYIRAAQSEAHKSENQDRYGVAGKPGQQLFEEAMKEMSGRSAGAGAAGGSLDRSGSSGRSEIRPSSAGSAALARDLLSENGMGKGGVVRGASGEPEALTFTHQGRGQ